MPGYCEFIKCDFSGLLSYGDRGKYPGPVNEIPEEMLPTIIGPFGRWQFMIMVILCTFMYLHGLSTSLDAILLPPGLTYHCKNAQFANETCYYRNGTKCKEFVFSKHHGPTITEKLRFVCELEFMSTLSRISVNFGMAVGSFTFGIIGDKYGRKMALVMSIIVQTLIGVSFLFCKLHYSVYPVMSLLYGTVSAGSFVAAIVLVTEFSPNKWRTLYLAAVTSPIMLGCITVILTTRLVNDPFAVIIYLTAPQCIMFAVTHLIDDSPNWLYSRDKYDKADEVIRRAAKRNLLALSELFRVQPHFVLRPSHRFGRNIWQMFLDSRVNRSTIALTIHWFLMFSCILLTNHTVFSDITDTAAIIIGVSQILLTPIICFGACYFLQHKVVLFILTLVGSGFMLGHNSLYFPISIVAYVTALTTLFNLSPRCFPTDMRCQGLGLCLGSGYLGFCFTDALFPHLEQLHKDVFYVLSTIVIFLCCILYWNVEKRELPDLLIDCIMFNSMYKPVRYFQLSHSVMTEDDEIEMKILSMRGALDADRRRGFPSVIDVSSTFSTVTPSFMTSSESYIQQ